MRPSKPAFHSVLDLGLRDVGVANAPARVAAHLARWAVPMVGLALAFAVMVCAVMRRIGAEPWMLGAFALSWTAATIAFALGVLRNAPIVVVKVTGSGTNQATWVALGHLALLALAVAVAGRVLLLLPVVALAAPLGLLALRGRDRVPAMLRALGSRLEAGERVEGDGLGLDRGARRRSEAICVLAATDRRLLLASAAGVSEVAYASVDAFAIGFKLRGRVGELALIVAGHRRVFTSVGPANVVSIARSLRAHGVGTADPGAVADAETAWEEALGRNRARRPFFDREAMRTREFDRGLWLLLGLCAVVFYPNRIGIGSFGSAAVAVLLVAVPVVCALCGYVSRTRSSLAYLVPLNLLLTPTFFFADASGVILMMLALSALAAIGLRAGASLGTRRDAPVRDAATARGGGVRDAISGRSLVRISAVLLGVVMAGVTATSAAGFDLTSLRHAAAARRLPADGRSNLTGGAASLRYTPAGGLHEVVTDEDLGAGPDDGARWELRSSADGSNAVTLAHYIFDDPRLDDEAAVARFVADKDADHSELAGSRVTHTERVVDGRTGYVWDHELRDGGWYSTAWFPQPTHSVRLECYTRDPGQTDRFKRLCAEAIRSLTFTR